MNFKEETARFFVDDARWKGIITEKMVRVWRTRGVIPNQYFNPKYVDFIKQGKEDLAEQVIDKYYNPKFVIKTELTPDEKLLQEHIIRVLKNEKIRSTIVTEMAGVSYQKVIDVQKHSVNLRSEDLLNIKKVIAEIRIKINKVLAIIESKTSNDVKIREIDSLLTIQPLCASPIINNKLYAGRHYQRNLKEEFKYYDLAEIDNAYIRLKELYLELSL